MHELPLFSLAPGLRAAFPRLSLGNFPTPLERVESLSRELGCSFFVKRDDISGTLYGGNKVRKLEFLLGEAKAQDAQALVTIGGLGSHHVLATCLYGRAAGFRVGVGLFPQPMTPHAEDTLSLTLGSGAEARPAPLVTVAPLVVARRYASFRARGLKTLVIPPGGSSAVGSLGYVNAALELAAQVEAGAMPAPDVVVTPLGSNGTAAGLALGLRLAGLKATLLAVRVVDLAAANRPLLLGLVASTAQVLRKAGLRSAPWWPGEVEIAHDQFGEGYGYPTPSALRAKEAASVAGLALETTYTAKTLAALFARREALVNKTVLFWDTFSSADLSRLPRGDARAFLGDARLQSLRGWAA